MLHFGERVFRYSGFRLIDGDALGSLAGGGLGIGDGQDTVLHRGFDVLGLKAQHNPIRSNYHLLRDPETMHSPGYPPAT